MTLPCILSVSVDYTLLMIIAGKNFRSQCFVLSQSWRTFCYFYQGLFRNLLYQNWFLVFQSLLSIGTMENNVFFYFVCMHYFSNKKQRENEVSIWHVLIVEFDLITLMDR